MRETLDHLPEFPAEGADDTRSQTIQSTGRMGRISALSGEPVLRLALEMNARPTRLSKASRYLLCESLRFVTVRASHHE